MLRDSLVVVSNALKIPVRRAGREVPSKSKSGNFQADIVSVIMGHATLSNSSCDAPAASLAYLVSNSIILCFCFVQARCGYLRFQHSHSGQAF